MTSLRENFHIAMIGKIAKNTQKEENGQFR